MTPKRTRRRRRSSPPREEGVTWDEVAPWDRVDWIILAAVTGLALFLRLFRLEAMLEGLHHDEAITGLEAMRVLSDGYIGPYTASISGQALGPAYWTALIFWIGEPTRFTLLLSMALLGAATVPAAYVFFRLSFGRGVALFAAVALSFSHWHLYYSRSGFMLAAMPLVTTLSAAALLWALRSVRSGPVGPQARHEREGSYVSPGPVEGSPSGNGKKWLAGAALGLGVYSYTAYVAWIAIVAALLCCYAVLERDRARLWAVGFALLAVGFATAAWPMAWYAILDTDVFLNRYLVAGVDSEKTLGYWAERAWTALALPFYHPARDAGTGFGGYGAMGWALGPLAYAGFVICLSRWRSPPHLLLALAFVAGLGVLLLGVPDQGEYRRSLLMVPFSFGLAGIAAVTLGRWAADLIGWKDPYLPFALSLSKGPKGGIVAATIATALLAVAESSWAYWKDHRNVDSGFDTGTVAVLDAVHAAEPGVIYWNSAQYGDIAKQLFLYPESRLVDRSREEGDARFVRLDDGPATFVLMGDYTVEIDELRELQPGGTVTEDEYGRFVIYRLPAR